MYCIRLGGLIFDLITIAVVFEAKLAQKPDFSFVHSDFVRLHLLRSDDLTAIAAGQWFVVYYGHVGWLVGWLENSVSA